MDSARARGRHRVAVENEMIRKREREFLKDQMWKDAKNYFENWEKKNTKYEAWTSPRYYEDNAKMIKDLQTKREKEEKLENRRRKLKKLLDDEQKTYDIELMISKTHKPSHSKLDDIPVDILKEVNNSLKIEEDAKRRKEAEMKLYHQWRINNPLVRQMESKYMSKNLKLSWLDQQIEKRMQKEKEEEECKKVLKEREERMKIEKEREEKELRELEEKKKMLKYNLDKQIEELLRKNKESEELRNKQNDEIKKKIQLEELEEKQKEETKRRAAKEVALFNIRQHKMKLKQKSADIQENLLKEREFVTKLRQLELEEMIENERKRAEIKQGLDEFLQIMREQEELEKKRKKCFEFIFDSEAKAIYEKQEKIWRTEEANRKKLVEEVFETLRKQTKEKVNRNKQKQKEVLREREEMLKKIEKCNNELEKIEEEEKNRRTSRKKNIEEDIKVKAARKKQQENFKLKEIDEELERIRNEEKRLQEEILKIQNRQGPARTRLFY